MNRSAGLRHGALVSWIAPWRIKCLVERGIDAD